MGKVVIDKNFHLTNSDLSDLLTRIDLPVIMLGLDLAVRRFTPPAEAAFGLSPAIIGRQVGDIGLPLRLPNLRPLLLAVIRAGAARELQVQDRRGRWYQLFLRPYRNDKHRIEGAVMAFIDIHDRKISEKVVLRLATLVRDSNDAVIIRDPRDRVIAWNKGAQKMYGYKPEEALGMNVSRLMPKSGHIGSRDLLRLSARGKQTAPVECRRLTKDGRLLDVLLTVTLLCDEKGNPAEIATTERDITARKEADRQMRRLHTSVVSAQETERKRLAYGLHDGVGQILSGVKYRLAALAGKSVADKVTAGKLLEVAASLDKAISEIRRVSEDLMPSELENLGLVPALRTLCREFEPTGASLKLRTGQIQAVVHRDLALALFRITQEALNNIAKHARATSILVNLSQKNGALKLCVRDNGAGFSPGRHRSSGKKGLGLLSMRERAESLGGSIDLRSTPGAGTTLKVTVPLAGPPANATS